jgi:soluble lytic murein transglycosylase-like protein
MTSTPYRKEIEGAAHEHGLDPNLVEAVVICESSGRTDAFRHEPGFYDRYLKGKPQWASQNPRRIASSYGLMQVMYTTALEHGYGQAYDAPEFLFIPTVGLDAGCEHLAKQIEWANGDLLKALAAYNGGQGNWMAGQPQLYAKKVNRVLEEIQKARK